MIEFTLSNGVKMPSVGLGTFLMQPDKAEQAVYDALKMGYRMVDTANGYLNERAVGRGIKKSGVPREEIFLATKLWPTVYENPGAVDKCLELLDTDYIDLLYIHQPSGNYLAGYKQLEDAYKAGRIKAIGISNFSLDQIKEANADGYVDVVEDEFSLLHQDHAVDMMPYLKDHHISFVPYFPLASGLLTGKYDQSVSFPADDIRSQISDFQEPRYSQALTAIDQVRPIAQAHHATVAQTVLAWYMQNPLISVVIPGAKRASQVEANAQALDVTLTSAEYQTIDQAFTKFKAATSGKSLADPD